MKNEEVDDLLHQGHFADLLLKGPLKSLVEIIAVDVFHPIDS